MFGALLKQITHRRTFTPLFMQTRTNTYKRDVVSDDIDLDKYNNKFDKKSFDKILHYNGKDLYYPKYGFSLYDDKLIDEYKKNNERED